MIAGKFSNVFVDLDKRINPLHLNPDMLVGCHIPNLITKPFDITKEYAQIIYNQTSSCLDKVFRKWDEKDGGLTEQCQQLAYVVLVELLVYQFASPVRRTETQDLLFTIHNFERFIDSPTLTGMATRTLKTKYGAGANSVSRTGAIICHTKQAKAVYHPFEDKVAAEDSAPEPATASTPLPLFKLLLLLLPSPLPQLPVLKVPQSRV